MIEEKDSLLVKELKSKIGKDVVIFNKINFKFFAKIIEVDNFSVKFFDKKQNKNRVMAISQIGQLNDADEQIYGEAESGEK